MSIYVSCINWNREVPNWYEYFYSTAQARIPKVTQTLILLNIIHKEEEGTKHFDDGTELKEVIIELEEEAEEPNDDVDEEIALPKMPLMKSYDGNEKMENVIKASSSIFQESLSMCQPYPFMLASLDTDHLIVRLDDKESPKFQLKKLFISCFFWKSLKE